MLLATMPAAYAAPTDPISATLLAGPDGTNGTADDEIIAIAGSDTLEIVTTDIAKTFPATVRDKVYNIRPGQVAGITTGKTVWKGDGTLTGSVPGETGKCSAVTFDPSEGVGQNVSDTDADGIMWPPNGSSEGRAALSQAAGAATYGSASIDTGNGCIDVARMSSRPGATPSNLEGYAFGLDLANWGTTSLNAPGSLTMAQLIGIF